MAAYCALYESLTPERLEALEPLLSPDVRFIDPFNDVTGPAAVRRVFEHMFRQCADPRFQVLHTAMSGGTGYIQWYFFCGGVRVEGVSRVSFDAEGRVSRHEDFWDPARQLYERVPVLGALMRLLRRRLSAKAG
ncbi:nuclear transport factor 2 family protein [Ectothiorhodospiraceae bacterium WFHF3C12]|nr:nuclear transport factor 2 family protein [Ectothiorhodospiraceae bacterium WFHF3C12]